MSDVKKLRDLKLADFVTLQDSDDLEAYGARHTSDPELHVVLVDAEGTPTAVTTIEDIDLGFPSEDLFLADEEISVLQLNELRPILESQGFTRLGVMSGQDIVGIVSTQKLQSDMAFDVPLVPAEARYRCRRYPRCFCEKIVPLADEPPLCEFSAAHGHMVLIG